MPQTNTGTLTSGSGATTFVALTDTPSSFSGQGSKVVAVNSGATALEFTTAGAGDVTLNGTQTLTNKTIDADVNTISDLQVANLKAGVLDTDLTSVSGSDDTLPSAKATKTALDLKASLSDEETLLLKKLKFPTSLSANQYYGEVIQITSSNTFGELVKFSSSGVVLSDANTTNDRVDGVHVATDTILKNGVFYRSGTAGDKLYMSTTAGAITTTAPSASGDVVQQIGIQITTTCALLTLDKPCIELV